MPKFTVYITCTTEDTVEVEAADRMEAVNMVENNINDYLDILPFAIRDGFALTWDDIYVYDAIEEEN